AALWPKPTGSKSVKRIFPGGTLARSLNIIDCVEPTQASFARPVAFCSKHLPSTPSANGTNAGILKSKERPAKKGSSNCIRGDCSAPIQAEKAGNSAGDQVS